jgi:HSP20 family protein
MFTPWFDIDGTFAEMETARRQMEALLHLAMNPKSDSSLGWADVTEEADGWRLTADFPGLAPGDFEVNVHGGQLGITAERRVTPPEGYQPRRQERRPWKLTRTLALPKSVDVERITASLTDGVLTVQLPKLPEVQPRSISVTAS